MTITTDSPRTSALFHLQTLKGNFDYLISGSSNAQFGYAGLAREARIAFNSARDAYIYASVLTSDEMIELGLTI